MSIVQYTLFFEWCWDNFYDQLENIFRIYTYIYFKKFTSQLIKLLGQPFEWWYIVIPKHNCLLNHFQKHNFFLHHSLFILLWLIYGFLSFRWRLLTFWLSYLQLLIYGLLYILIYYLFFPSLTSIARANCTSPKSIN